MSTCRGQLRGLQRQGAGAEEGGHVEGKQHPHHRGHVQVTSPRPLHPLHLSRVRVRQEGAGEQAGAEEVHEGGEEELSRDCL